MKNFIFERVHRMLGSIWNLICDFFIELICTVAGAVIMYFFRLFRKKLLAHTYKRKLLIDKKQINEDFSNVVCYTANPDHYDEQEYTYLGYPFEHMALGEINSMFRYVYKVNKSLPHKIARIDFENYPNEVFYNNLILIGGPVHNSITKNFVFSGNIRLPFSYDENNNLIFSSDNNSKQIRYEAVMYNGDDKYFEKDYALILNIKNPKDDKKRVILISGCRSIGCYGGATFLSNNLKKIKNIVKDQEYAIVVECEGNKDGLIKEPKFIQYFPLNT